MERESGWWGWVVRVGADSCSYHDIVPDSALALALALLLAALFSSTLLSLTCAS
jgi:hypothetical protein